MQSLGPCVVPLELKMKKCKIWLDKQRPLLYDVLASVWAQCDEAGDCRVFGSLPQSMSDNRAAEKDWGVSLAGE